MEKSSILNRPYYNKALKALQAAHDACLRNKTDVLGMSNGPFSGVNEALGIVDFLEKEVEDLKEQIRVKDLRSTKGSESKVCL